MGRHECIKLIITRYGQLDSLLLPRLIFWLQFYTHLNLPLFSILCMFLIIIVLTLARYKIERIKVFFGIVEAHFLALNRCLDILTNIGRVLVLDTNVALLRRRHEPSILVAASGMRFARSRLYRMNLKKQLILLLLCLRLSDLACHRSFRLSKFLQVASVAYFHVEARWWLLHLSWVREEFLL